MDPLDVFPIPNKRKGSFILSVVLQTVNVYRLDHMQSLPLDLRDECLQLGSESAFAHSLTLMGCSEQNLRIAS